MQNPLSAILKQERERRGLDVEALAESLGFHRRVIADWEAGKICPRYGSAIRWANALGYGIEIVPAEPSPTTDGTRRTLTLKSVSGTR